MNLAAIYPKGTLRTYSGGFLNVIKPKAELIKIEDIAHALSYQPRWLGHTEKFWSVAAHSLLCLQLFKEMKPFATNQEMLTVLLHDASEAYLCDVPKPIKEQLPDYRMMEANLELVIADKYNLEFPFKSHVKIVDTYAAELEYSEFMEGDDSRCIHTLFQYSEPAAIRQMFIKAYEDIHKRALVITFEDGDQLFTQWEVANDGMITNCLPLGGEDWIGTRIASLKKLQHNELWVLMGDGQKKQVQVEIKELLIIC